MSSMKVLVAKPANPLSPTAKELAEAFDLTPYLVDVQREWNRPEGNDNEVVEWTGNVLVNRPVKP
jgi:hypothetical protein